MEDKDETVPLDLMVLMVRLHDALSECIGCRRYNHESLLGLIAQGDRPLDPLGQLGALLTGIALRDREEAVLAQLKEIMQRMSQRGREEGG